MPTPSTWANLRTHQRQPSSGGGLGKHGRAHASPGQFMLANLVVLDAGFGSDLLIISWLADVLAVIRVAGARPPPPVVPISRSQAVGSDSGLGWWESKHLAERKTVRGPPAPSSLPLQPRGFAFHLPSAHVQYGTKLGAVVATSFIHSPPPNAHLLQPAFPLSPCPPRTPGIQCSQEASTIFVGCVCVFRMLPDLSPDLIRLDPPNIISWCPATRRHRRPGTHAHRFQTPLPP